MKIEISGAQRDAILAGLRLLQIELSNKPGFEIHDLWWMVFTNEGEHAGLSVAEVEELCKSINAPRGA